MDWVVVRADVYERASQTEFDPSEAYRAIDEAWAPGWDDPRMAEYDSLLR